MLELNKIILGDCIEVMKGFEDNCIDSIVMDPPYGIGFMGKEWDTFKPDYLEEKKDPRGRYKSGMAGGSPAKTAGTYDYSRNKEFQEWFTIFSIECLRIMKPGGHLLSFGGTRTCHRMVCGIEDAGFEIRDSLQWIYSTGFPKNLDIGKQIDKMKGAEREIIDKNPNERINDNLDKTVFNKRKECNLTIPATPEAKQWDGWGTALKPANEPIVLARKPISEKNIALNVLKWGTGGIAIDKCRIKTDKRRMCGNTNKSGETSYILGSRIETETSKGRWPANVIFDEEAAALLDEQSKGIHGAGYKIQKQIETKKHEGIEFLQSNGQLRNTERFGDSGGASRFFYMAKASKSERNAGLEGFEKKNKIGFNASKREYDNQIHKEIKLKNIHPTCKPIKLMRYLVRLITPPGGICLDPFLGSGTTAIACIEEGFDYIGIEKEKEYFDIAEKRIFHYKRQLKLF